MSEEVLCDLVRDEAFAAAEVVVLEAAVEWINGGGGEEGRGKRLLGEIRYGLLEASKLAEVRLSAEEMLGGRQGARLRGLVDKAVAVQRLPLGEQGRQEHVHLCKNAFVARIRRFVGVCGRVTTASAGVGQGGCQSSVLERGARLLGA